MLKKKYLLFLFCLLAVSIAGAAKCIGKCKRYNSRWADIHYSDGTLANSYRYGPSIIKHANGTY